MKIKPKFIYVTASLHGALTSWYYTFGTDKKVFNSKEACYAHALKTLGHEDFFIVQIKYGKPIKLFNSFNAEPVDSPEAIKAMREQISL